MIIEDIITLELGQHTAEEKVIVEIIDNDNQLYLDAVWPAGKDLEWSDPVMAMVKAYYSQEILEKLVEDYIGVNREG